MSTDVDCNVHVWCALQVSLAALPEMGPPAARRLALEWAVRGWQAVILRVWCAHAGKVRPRRHA